MLKYKIIALQNGCILDCVITCGLHCWFLINSKSCGLQSFPVKKLIHFIKQYWEYGI